MPNGIPTVDNAIDTGILIDRVANLELYISQILVPALNTGQTPTGSIIPWGANANLPNGYLLCNGASVSRTTYSALYDIIGTAFGTASGTTFNLPDFQGQFLRGRDNSSGRDPNAATRTAQNTGGATGDNVGSVQTANISQHSHHTPIVNGPSQSASNNLTAYSGISSPATDNGVFATSQYQPTSSGTYGLMSAISGISSGTGSLPTTVSFVHTGKFINQVNEDSGDTRPKNSYVNFIIKYTANVSL